MWELYTRALKGSINQHVPTKTIKPRHRSVLEWFNRKAKKHKKWEEPIDKQSSPKTVLTMNTIEH